MHRILAAGHMAQPYVGAEYSDVPGDPNIRHHSGYLPGAQGIEGTRLRYRSWRPPGTHAPQAPSGSKRQSG